MIQPFFRKTVNPSDEEIGIAVHNINMINLANGQIDFIGGTQVTVPTEEAKSLWNKLVQMSSEYQRTDY
jgi:hypothetical protein